MYLSNYPGLPEFFREALYTWHKAIDRPMPWVGEKDPYRIWVSEVILQQTRVVQGLSYYKRFTTEFPDVQALAQASEEAVFKCWEGLGYYSRARNMMRTARVILEDWGGTFPDTYEGLLSLPGVGPYTAAAIASFAYALPYPVVDGNVERILSRVAGIETLVDSPEGKKQIRALAEYLFDASQPAAFNQAMMDFGALQCVPRMPTCASCPFAEHCVALQKGLVQDLPRKKPKQPRSNRFFHYLVFVYDTDTWVRKRAQADIWAGLYEFPLLETESPDLDIRELLKELSLLLKNPPVQENVLPSPSRIYRQTLSHQVVNARFWTIPIARPLEGPHAQALERIPRAALPNLAFPRAIRWYLEEKSLRLNLF
jgi:A/G-specific adenine glycosylase